MAFQKPDAELLYQHLQALIDVELFTIPFYLTAASSVSSSAADSNSDVQALQQEAVSVAVQEMYHLQQACNLCNAFDVTPRIPHLEIEAGVKTPVPHLDPNNAPLVAELGNLPAVIAALIAIEAPDDSPDPVVPNEKVIYRSIADLYKATLELLAAYLRTFERIPAALDPFFDPGHNQIGYGAFPQRFNYNQIQTRLDVMNTINAITDQGEGTIVAPKNSPFLFGSDGKVRPEYQGLPADRFVQWDVYTHYWRFEDINTKLASVAPSNFYQDNGQKSPDLPAWAPPLATIQSAITTIWSFLLDTMQAGFASGNLPANNTAKPALPGFNSAMIAFKYLIPMVWQYGAVPSFTYTGGVTAEQVQNAMDAVDPWCLFHWDAASSAVRAQYPNDLNTCQGLNICAGRGWGGIATAAGNGACALADTHTCTGSNSCTGQGGCGYFSSLSDGTLLPPSEQWVPGQNTGAGSGGCQTPVATKQVFHNYPDSSFPTGYEYLEPLRTTFVWDRARALLAQKLGVESLPTPIAKTMDDIDYDGTKRRAAVTPSSTAPTK
jgi:hypothetical protein